MLGHGLFTCRCSLRAVYWAVVAAAAGIVSSGCGDAASKTVRLQGAVTLAGKPLPDDAQGSITFRPATSQQAPAVTVPIAGGRYDSPNTPAGKVKVYFNVQAPTGRTYKSERAGGQVAEMQDVVPEKYAQGLDLDVAGDSDEQNFDLGDKES
jgi:hypothetical protein